MTRDYEAEISKRSSDELVEMLIKLRAGTKLPAWPDGKAFEHIVLRGFAIEGAQVKWPYSVYVDGKQIEQIDGAVHLDYLSCLVEAKDRDQKEGIESIAKLRSQLQRRPATTMGLVFTTNEFSEPAKTLTRMMNPLSVLLWEYNELEAALAMRTMCRALRTKLRYAVEFGMPDYNVQAGTA